MDTAKLNERVVIFRKEKQLLNDGTEEYALNEIGNYYANIRFQSGKEVIKSGVIAANTVLIAIRFSDKITANDIILWRGKYINITAVNPDYTGRKYTEIIGEIGVINADNLMG